MKYYGYNSQENKLNYVGVTSNVVSSPKDLYDLGLSKELYPIVKTVEEWKETLERMNKSIQHEFQ